MLFCTVGLDLNSENVKWHNIPASEQQILDNDPNGEDHLQTWNYRSAISCLSYVQPMICPDLTMAVQQCAQFCNSPK